VVIATGIVNYKGINSDNSDAFVQQYQVENAFSNLLEFAQSRPAIKLVTIEMLQHDLGGQTAFRQPNPALPFSEQEKQRLLQQLKEIKLDSLEDPSFSPDFDFLLDKVARAYRYDNDAILRGLSVKRKGQTDYLDIAVTTEIPALSQYLVNAYARRFLTYYYNLLVREKRKNVDSYAKLATEKKAVVDSISDIKFEYLKQKGLPVLGRQSEELVAQITKLEFERQRADARKRSAAESVNRIKKYESDRESRDAWEVQSRLLDKNSTAEQMERIEAEASYNRTNNEIYALKNKLGSMVVSDEVYSKLQQEQDNAQLEFDKVNDEFIKAKLTLENAENPLTVVQTGQLPEWPEPDRRTLISIFAARNPDAATTAFRESLRKLRGQIMASGGKTWLLMSVKTQEGKTFTMLSLAHSLAYNQKRVLMLDTNFKAPLPESFTDQPSVHKELLNGLLKKHGIDAVFQLKDQSAVEAEGHGVEVLGNVGLPKSPAELLGEPAFRAFLADLGAHFDYILMEAAALNEYSDAQELAPYADRILAVFNAHSTLKAADQTSLDYLRTLGPKFAGAVLTEVNGRRGFGS
jgi:Mrp family chromosome partitioning ATPase